MFRPAGEVCCSFPFEPPFDEVGSDAGASILPVSRFVSMGHIHQFHGRSPFWAVLCLVAALSAPSVAQAAFDGHPGQARGDGPSEHRSEYARPRRSEASTESAAKCSDQQLPYYDTKGHVTWRLTKVCGMAPP